MLIELDALQLVLNIIKSDFMTQIGFCESEASHSHALRSLSAKSGVYASHMHLALSYEN